VNEGVGEKRFEKAAAEVIFGFVLHLQQLQQLQDDVGHCRVTDAHVQTRRRDSNTGSPTPCARRTRGADIILRHVQRTRQPGGVKSNTQASVEMY
jgi:hypothetical protein